MKKLIITSIITTLTLAGCAISDTTVIPRGNNQFEIVSTAMSEHSSTQGALDKANKVCEERQLGTAVVINHNTVYQGVDKTVGSVTDTLAILASAANKDSNQIAPSTRRWDDYKTTMLFRCR